MAVPKLKRKKARSPNHVVLRIIAYTCALSFCVFMALYLFRYDRAAIDIEESKSNVESKSASATAAIGASKTINADKDNGEQMELKSIRGGDVGKKQQEKSTLPETITLKTSEGDLRIKLRPDLSLESVQYIQKLLEDPNPCSNCRFYRAEKPGILQGILKKKNVNKNRVLGKCPEGLRWKKHKRFEHDPNCGCHGPIMKRGMIAWAAGEGGPDFFIDTYIRDATWWNTDHTVWGELADADSLAVAMGMYDLPATKKTLTYLDKAIHIDISSP